MSGVYSNSKVKRVWSIMRSVAPSVRSRMRKSKVKSPRVSFGELSSFRNISVKYKYRKIKMTKKDKTIKTEPDDEATEITEIDTSIVKGSSYEDKLNNVSIIANPMAPKKLTKKIYKLIKKATKHKTFLRNGLNDVQKHIRKGETGLVVFAGDVTPIEIMCHLPAVCEDKDIPYCYTPSRQDIGVAMGVKRGSLMVLIKENPEYKDLYDEIKKEMIKLALPL